jgi:predicted DNA-binding transcriptional regulator AlpA
MHSHRSNSKTEATRLNGDPRGPEQDATAFDLVPLLDYSDLARITGEGISTHRRRQMLGTGPRSLRIGGRHIRFHPRDVVAWLESCAQTGHGRAEAA